MKKLILIITLIATTSLVRANEIIPIWNSSVGGGEIQDMEILPGGEQALILAGIVDSKFFFVDTETGETIREVPTRYFTYANFEITPDSTRIVTAMGSNYVEVRDIETLELIDSANITRPDKHVAWLSQTVVDPIRPIAYFCLVARRDFYNGSEYKSKIIAYNYETMESLPDITDFADVYSKYNTLAISNDGKYLATINDGFEAYLKIWDLETNQLIVNKALFDEGSDYNCFTRGLVFSKANPNIIYISGGYSDFMNDDGRRSSVFSYNFQEDIRTSIAPDGIYTSGNIFLFDNEERLVVSVGGAIGILNLNIRNLEWYNKPPNNGYSTILKYNMDKDHFLGASSTNDISKFRYDRETSIEKSYEEEIIISPNPTKSTVNINTGCDSELINYTIYNSQGQQTDYVNTTTTGSEFTVDMSNYPTGVYFITIDCNNHIVTYKIVKEG